MICKECGKEYSFGRGMLPSGFSPWWYYCLECMDKYKLSTGNWCIKKEKKFNN